MKEKLIKEYYNIPQMTIQKFISKYYNISCTNSKHITHKVIEYLFGINPYLRIEGINAENIEDIRSGYIILVLDGENNLMGYKNPFLEKDNEECKSIFDMQIFTEVHNASNHPLNLREEDVISLETYELEELLQISKKRSDDVSKRVIIKELHKRKGLENNHKEEIIEKVRKRELREEW